MAQAARQRGYQYIAITDHSKNLAFANGLDDSAPWNTCTNSRRNEQTEGITIMAGIEVDIWPMERSTFGRGAGADGCSGCQRAFGI